MTLRQMFLVATIAVAPALGFAAGSDETAPPKPTNTTKQCKDGKIWDAPTKSCVVPKDARLDDDARYRALREMAYMGQLREAQEVLAAFSNPRDDRALTYWGFTHRKLGRGDLALTFYGDALAQNPDNSLARSYMGQGMALAGNLEGARVQLAEIRARGGSGTWAEASLAKVLSGGAASNY